MKNSDSKLEFKILASRCNSCDCGCPTLLESGDGEKIVVVGEWDQEVLKNETVTAKIGENETAIVIPKSFLLEAIQSIKG